MIQLNTSWCIATCAMLLPCYARAQLPILVDERGFAGLEWLDSSFGLGEQRLADHAGSFLVVVCLDGRDASPSTIVWRKATEVLLAAQGSREVGGLLVVSGESAEHMAVRDKARSLHSDGLEHWVHVAIDPNEEFRTRWGIADGDQVIVFGPHGEAVDRVALADDVRLPGSDYFARVEALIHGIEKVVDSFSAPGESLLIHLSSRRNDVGLRRVLELSRHYLARGVRTILVGNSDEDDIGVPNNVKSVTSARAAQAIRKMCGVPNGVESTIFLSQRDRLGVVIPWGDPAVDAQSAIERILLVHVATARVRKVFQRIMRGGYSDVPSSARSERSLLGWDDVPFLLRMSKDQSLCQKPRVGSWFDPMTQFIESGVIALWLVESVMKDKMFPKDNVLYGLGYDPYRSERISAYRTWWRDAAKLRPEQRIKVSPQTIAPKAASWGNSNGILVRD